MAPPVSRQPPGMGYVQQQQQQQQVQPVPVPPPAPVPVVQPPPVVLTPIDQVVHLIQTSAQHQQLFKDLMIQICQLEQYKVNLT